jgi:hypothetical protein
MYGRSKNLSFKDFRDTSSSNDLYKSFWDQQEQIRQQQIKDGNERNRTAVSELDRYKQDVIDQAKAEVRAYERSHGNSGSFFKDMKFGMNYGNRAFIKPFIKYAGPIVGKMGPTGAAVMKSTEQVSGVVDKLT